MTAPAHERFKPGDIVRYADGVSALFRYDGTNNCGRLYGDHVMGGAGSGADGMFCELQPASAADLEFCRTTRPDWFTAPAPPDPLPAPGAGRRWLIDLVRDQFDPAPSHYKLDDDNWDDGAAAIADAILSNLPLLRLERSETAPIPTPGPAIDPRDAENERPRQALQDAIDVLDGMSNDEIDLELLPRLRQALAAESRKNSRTIEISAANPLLGLIIPPRS